MFKRTAAAGCLGTILPMVLVLVALAVVGDISARHYAAGQLSDRISAEAPSAIGVRARIHSFPFLGHLLTDGRIDDVGAHIDRVSSASGVVFHDLDIDLRGAVVDGGVVFRDRKVRVTSIRQGTVAVTLTEQSISTAIGRTVRITGGGVEVSVLNGKSVRAAVAVTPQRGLRVDFASLPAVTVPLPSAKLLPCVPQVSFGEGQVMLSCTFTRIPDAFVTAASGVAG